MCYTHSVEYGTAECFQPRIIVDYSCVHSNVFAVRFVATQR